MSTSIFSEKTAKPDEGALASAVKGSKVLWDEVKRYVASSCGNASEEWKFYSKRSGWILVVKSGQRTILYLIPLDGSFKTNFVYGEKAVNEAMKAGLPAGVMKEISEAKAYMEGRPFFFDVKTEKDVDVVKKLIHIKNKN